MSEPMQWVDATKAEIDPDAYYVTQTNGGEWRDFDLFVQRGALLKLHLEPHYVRGRPVWIAKVTPRPSQSK
jgi:hypothetical protein